MKKTGAAFLTDSSEYQRANADTKTIFRLEQRLPYQVFQDGYGDFRFLESDSIFRGDFWNVLSTCSNLFGDDQIYMSLLEPDPVSYYHRHFQRYGVMRIGSGSSEELYTQALFEDPGDSPSDAFAYNSFTACWWGSTRQWCFWAERSCNMAIAARLRTARSTWPTWPTLSSYAEGETPFNNIEDALDIASLEFSGDPAAYGRFRSLLLKNYGRS